jgi:acyl-CoA synthetase (NDP forming)
VIVVMTGRSAASLERHREALARLAAATPKPILLWSYTLPAPRSVEIVAEAGYPLYTSLRNCARTLRVMADYRAARAAFLRPAEAQAGIKVETAKARAALGTAGPVLCEWDARPILAAYGIGTNAIGTLANSAEAAIAAARDIGGPVALKVQSPGILHKTEAGAVALGLSTPEAIKAGYDRVLAAARRHAPDAAIQGVLVQPMAPPGREVILGITRDATFGPMLMVGLGGINVEILQDVALSPVPIGRREARDMLGRLKGAALLDAHRGAPAADIDALADLMVRLAQFASDHAEQIAEIDLNPVIVHAAGHGVSVVDALIVTR